MLGRYGEAGQLATIKAELEREMSGDWVKLSLEERTSKAARFACHIESDEMCLLLIAFTRVSCFFSQLVPLFYNHCVVETS